MKNKSIFGLGMLLLGSMSTGAEARPAPEKKFYLFGGVDAGMAFYSKSSISSATDASRSGLAAGIRGLASFYSKKWVYEGGLGYVFVSSKGTNSTNDVFRVYTRTIQGGGSVRYRINENWQVGPELGYWFSTDNGLNRFIFSSTSNNALIGGIQGVYEWQSATEPTKYRVGARWNTDLNISDRNLNLIQVFFQIGFSPFGGSNPKPEFGEELKESDLERAKPEAIQSTQPGYYENSPAEEIEPEVMSTPAPIQEKEPLPIGPQEKMVVILDLNSLKKDRIIKIGSYLAEHQDLWGKVTVSGHTDRKGKPSENEKASQNQADSVRDFLGQGGVPLERITAIGMGSKKPAKSGKNARIEFEFQGIKDGLVIQKAFKKK